MRSERGLSTILQCLQWYKLVLPRLSTPAVQHPIQTYVRWNALSQYLSTDAPRMSHLTLNDSHFYVVGQSCAEDARNEGPSLRLQLSDRYVTSRSERHCLHGLLPMMRAYDHLRPRGTLSGCPAIHLNCI